MSLIYARTKDAYLVNHESTTAPAPAALEHPSHPRLDLCLPSKEGMRLHWSGLHGSADVLAAVSMAKQLDQLCVVVTNQPATSDRWHDGVTFFSSDAS
ncbi:MAG: hypothetical protein VXZ19_02455, partial [Pseudomonadota bacterium]|nr:hypothetical protein [Pseudomonadota bacterium]